MANERFYGPGDPFWGWRCVLCGEVLDTLIWENRDHHKKVMMDGNKVTQKGRKERR
jgi:hypothetical protein